MLTETRTPAAHKIRTACDICYRAKMKCSKGHPCVACARSGNQCRYSVSHRLGRPPKGLAKVKVTNTSTRSQERVTQSTTTTPLSFTGYHSQAEQGFLTLDETFADEFSDSLQALSNSATPANHAFIDTENIANSLSSTKDDRPTWLTGIDHFSQSPIEMNPYNTPERSPRLAPKDHSYTNHNRDRGYRGEIARCHCFQQHSRFLCHLKDLDRTHNPQAIFMTLDAARFILRLWQGQLNCHSCRFDEDNGALLLSVMSIGIIIKRLWRFMDHRQENSSSSESSPDGTPIFSGMGIFGMESARTINRANHGESLRHNDLTALPITSPTKINVDEFQVPEEEKMFVIAMLVIRMLKRIKEAFEELRKSIGHETWGDTSEDHNCYPLGKLVPLMLDSLGESVQELEKSLKGFITQ
ncbi:hypothetical protein F4779DRAFT_568415 [Xylariaceae sp. FL0662B]|nr:hypothetical protein F4779DRAFT_568415 [Xylariaceae sp. FL0662B]